MSRNRLSFLSCFLARAARSILFFLHYYERTLFRICCSFQALLIQVCYIRTLCSYFTNSVVQLSRDLERVSGSQKLGQTRERVDSARGESHDWDKSIFCIRIIQFCTAVRFIVRSDCAMCYFICDMIFTTIQVSEYKVPLQDVIHLKSRGCLK